jgi:DNA-binding transcriptional regulator YiaG
MTKHKSSSPKNEFVHHLEKVIAGAMRQVMQAHGEILPNSVAKRVAAQLWAECSPKAHAHTKDWIRHTRGKLGLTQAKFAELIGTNQVTVARWENGVCEPSNAYLRVLEQEATYIPKSSSNARQSSD